MTCGRETLSDLESRFESTSDLCSLSEFKKFFADQKGTLTDEDKILDLVISYKDKILSNGFMDVREFLALMSPYFSETPL